MTSSDQPRPAVCHRSRSNPRGCHPRPGPLLWLSGLSRSSTHFPWTLTRLWPTSRPMRRRMSSRPWRWTGQCCSCRCEARVYSSCRVSSWCFSRCLCRECGSKCVNFVTVSGRVSGLTVSRAEVSSRPRPRLPAPRPSLGGRRTFETWPQMFNCKATCYYPRFRELKQTLSPEIGVK